jgi:simple sugar transport system permease protein
MKESGGQSGIAGDQAAVDIGSASSDDWERQHQAGAKAKSHRRIFRQRALPREQLGAAVALVAMLALFLILSGGRGFLSWAGLVNVAGVAAEIGIVSAFVTIVMVSGEFDIGFGSILALGSMIVIVALIVGYSFWFGLLVALVVACVVALVEGLLVVGRGIPSLFVTLAVAWILGGIVIFPYLAVVVPQTGSDLRPLIQADPLYMLFGTKLPGGFPISLAWWAAITLLVGHIFTRTSFGNWVFATGGSASSAHALGVPAVRIKYAIFFGTAIGGTVLAGLQVARVASATPALGVQLPFEAMIAVFIGGSRPGRGSVIGTALGAVTVAILRQGMIFTGISVYAYGLVLGGSLLIGYSINELLYRRAARDRT